MKTPGVKANGPLAMNRLKQAADRAKAAAKSARNKVANKVTKVGVGFVYRRNKVQMTILIKLTNKIYNKEKDYLKLH